VSIRVPQATAMAVGSELIALSPYQVLIVIMAAVTLASAAALMAAQARRPGAVPYQEPVPASGASDVMG
jgi:hypothetical protein